MNPNILIYGTQDGILRLAEADNQQPIFLASDVMSPNLAEGFTCVDASTMIENMNNFRSKYLVRPGADISIIDVGDSDNERCEPLIHNLENHFLVGRDTVSVEA